MQRILTSLLLGIVLIINACQPVLWRKQTKGLKAYPKKEFWYEWVGKDQHAPKPQVGEEVRIDYTLQKGAVVLDNSYQNAYPILVQIPEARYDNFFTKALKLMAEGDSLRVLIPANTVPELLGVYAREFEDEDLVTFTYKMHRIKDLATLNQEIVKEQAYLDSIRTTVPGLITKFKAGELENVQETPSGLSYLIFDQGKDTKASNGDVVSMHYICFSPEGKIVDDSYTNMLPLTFNIGTQSLIEGWSHGASLLGQGGKALLFIPPNLAYGSQGNGTVIPPNSLVVFYIEMMTVQKN